MSNQKFSGERVHKFCVDRWEYYKNRDGAYLPSIHDKQVFEDVSKAFKIPMSACEYCLSMCNSRMIRLEE